jgi:hypothetical protein
LVPYPSTLDVPHELVEHVSWLIYTRRRELRSPWRKLSCFKQALLTLAHLRKNETFAQAGAGFGVSEAVDETLQVLAAWAPGLHEALMGLGEGDYVIVDGTLMCCPARLMPSARTCEFGQQPVCWRSSASMRRMRLTSTLICGSCRARSDSMCSATSCGRSGDGRPSRC